MELESVVAAAAMVTMTAVAGLVVWVAGSVVVAAAVAVVASVWITETRAEVYIAELICQVSKVYDYPRQMRGNPIKSAITVG